MIFDDIRKAYAFYSEKMFGEAKEFPYSTTPEEGGGPYCELSPDGKMALLAKDRGIECSRQETYSVDEFMYFIFSWKAVSLGFREGPADRPYEENRRIAAEELGKLKPEWKLRFLEETSGS
jgi:hypothetical protein